MPERIPIELFGQDISTQIFAALQDQLRSAVITRNIPGGTDPDNPNGPDLPGIVETYSCQGLKTEEWKHEDDPVTGVRVPYRDITIIILAQSVTGLSRMAPTGGEIINPWSDEFSEEFGGSTSAGSITVPIDTVIQPKDVIRFTGEGVDFTLMEGSLDEAGVLWEFKNRI